MSELSTTDRTKKIINDELTYMQEELFHLINTIFNNWIDKHPFFTLLKEISIENKGWQQSQLLESPTEYAVKLYMNILGSFSNVQVFLPPGNVTVADTILYRLDNIKKELAQMSLVRRLPSREYGAFQDNRVNKE